MSLMYSSLSQCKQWERTIAVFTVVSPKRAFACFTSLFLKFVLVSSASSHEIGRERKVWTSPEPSMYLQCIPSVWLAVRRPAPRGIPFIRRGNFLLHTIALGDEPYTFWKVTCKWKNQRRWQKKKRWQKCIPVGCVPSAAVAVGGGGAWGCLPGGCLPGGYLPGGWLPRGCLPRRCTPSCNQEADTPCTQRQTPPTFGPRGDTPPCEQNHRQT